MLKKIFLIIIILLFWGCLKDTVSNLIVPPFSFSCTLMDVKFFGGSDEEVAREINELKEGGYAMVGSTKSTDGDIS